MTARKSVLILCTGNSCRSQMAEGLINLDLADLWHAESAGTQPAGYVHPLAIQVLAEVGADLSQNRSKSTEEFRGRVFDVVITVCDDAAENCPLWLGEGRKVHIGFPDPAHASGDAETVLNVFRGVRDDIRARIIGYLVTINHRDTKPQSNTEDFWTSS